MKWKGKQGQIEHPRIQLEIKPLGFPWDVMSNWELDMVVWMKWKDNIMLQEIGERCWRPPLLKEGRWLVDLGMTLTLLPSFALSCLNEIERQHHASGSLWEMLKTTSTQGGDVACRSWHDTNSATLICLILFEWNGRANNGKLSTLEFSLKWNLWDSHEMSCPTGSWTWLFEWNGKTTSCFRKLVRDVGDHLCSKKGDGL